MTTEVETKPKVGDLVHLDTDPCWKGKISAIMDEYVYVAGLYTPYPLERWILSE
jgi:hypothetical protein